MSALDRLHRLTRKVSARCRPERRAGPDNARARGSSGFQIHVPPMRPQAEQLADKQRTLQDEASFASALEEEGAGWAGDAAAAVSRLPAVAVAMLERRKAGAMRALEAHRPAQIARRPDGAGDSREVDAGATAERAKSLDAFSMALAHRLMGRSIFFPERDPDCVGIRFDTCFGGACPPLGGARRVTAPASSPPPRAPSRHLFRAVLRDSGDASQRRPQPAVAHASRLPPRRGTGAQHAARSRCGPSRAQGHRPPPVVLLASPLLPLECGCRGSLTQCRTR